MRLNQAALRLPLLSAALFPAAVLFASLAATPAARAADAAGEPAHTGLTILNAALQHDWADRELAFLTDHIGPRLSGSPQAEAAVAQVAETMRALGLEVTLQPVKVPHWVRGEERGELIDYPQRPAGLTQKIHLTALGGSSATPAKGLTAPVLVLGSMADIDRRADEIRGRIVLVSVPFNQALADNGRSGIAYGQAGAPRFQAPAKLAALGAAAALVRSVGGADFRLPHTGASNWEEGKLHIPAAAVTVEDALLIERLAREGEVRMKLTLTPKTLPDADSHNVIVDLKGSEKPDEVVIVSGHLDSWDLGTGAIDDGAGTVSALAVVELLKELGIQPRRTIRAIAWMNEENGSRGGKAYFEANRDRLAQHVAAIESDSGAGRPLGLLANVSPETMNTLAPLLEILEPIGATAFEHVESAVGADITPLQAAGVPGFEPLLDTHDYFHYHHTAADTLDKVKPDNLRRQVAVMAVLAWYLADLPEPLPRIPLRGDED